MKRTTKAKATTTTKAKTSKRVNTRTKARTSKRVNTRTKAKTSKRVDTRTKAKTSKRVNTRTKAKTSKRVNTKLHAKRSTDPQLRDDTYRSMTAGRVNELSNEGARVCAYKPEVQRMLALDGVHRPSTPDSLDAQEAMHLRAIFKDRLEAQLADPERALECASVRDASSGEIAYRLYAWNYGVAYLFDASRVRLVAHGTQHDLEIWDLAQRPLFWSMDGALRAPGHGLRQPLVFPWWVEYEWDEVREAQPGTTGSQPWLKSLLGDEPTPSEP